MLARVLGRVRTRPWCAAVLSRQVSKAAVNASKLMRWEYYKEGESLLTLHAEPRERFLGKLGAARARQEGKIPVVVISRDSNKQAVQANQINATISKEQLLALDKSGRMYNQVFNIKLSDREEPVKAIVAKYYAEAVYMQPESVIFSTFVPGKRHKIKIPCFLDNFHDSLAIKKGASLQKIDDYVGFYWKGSEQIPKSIVLDLLTAAPPMTFAVDGNNLPEGLSLVRPAHNHVLATLKGNRRYFDQAEEEEAN